MNRNASIVIMVLGLCGLIASILQLFLIAACASLLVLIFGIWGIIPLEFDYSRKHSHSKEHSEKTNS